MAQSSDNQNQSGAEISFSEAEDYVEQRRQKEVLDAVQFVLKTQNENKIEFERGVIDIETRRAEVRTAVESLIMETEQIIKKAGDEALLEGKPLGSVSLQPPSELVSFVKNSDNRVWGDSSLTAKKVQTIYGVRGFLNAPETFTATWSVKADVRGQGPQEVPMSASIRMPVAVSMSVFRAIKRFLSDVELDLNAQLNDYTGQNGPGL